MLPVLQNLIVEATGGRALGRAMALATLPALIGPMLGPVVGGLIISHLSWHWIFWVNVPFAVSGCPWLGGAWPPTPGARQRARCAGTGAAFPGRGGPHLWAHPGRHQKAASPMRPFIVPLAARHRPLVAFVIHALRTRGEPIVDLRLFWPPDVLSLSSLLFLSGLALYGAMLLLPLYYQQLRGQSVLWPVCSWRHRASACCSPAVRRASSQTASAPVRWC